MRRNLDHFIQEKINQNDSHKICVPVWGNSSLPIFRIYLDPELGNDDNDGLTWNTAKKTIAAADALVPFDLQGAHVLLMMHPGTYEINTAVGLNHINGVYRLCWLGEFINNSASEFAAWVRNGKENPIRNSDQVIIRILTGGDLVLSSVSRSCSYSFWQRDESLLYYQPGFCYWDRFVIKIVGTGRFSFFSTVFGDDNGWTLDCSEAGNGSPIETNGSYHFVNAIKIIGGDSGIGQETGTWRGAFYYGNEVQTEWKYAQLGFADGYAPPNNLQYEFTNFKQVLSSGVNINVKHNINIPANKITWSAGTTGLTAPIFYLGTGATGTITTDQTQIAVSDNSLQQHTVTDLSSNSINTFITPDLKVKDSFIIQKSKNAVPGDTLLENNTSSFFLDQAANKLLIKVKYSDGTIKSGEITLT